MEYIIENNGKRRKAINKKCEHCGKDFLHRINEKRSDRGKYCSKECASKSKMSRVEVKCSGCGKVFEKKKSQLKNSRSGLYFCSRECKDLAQRFEYGIKEIWPEHYGNGYSVYKNLIIRAKNPTCCDCGEDKKYILMVHHIDGDRENNAKDNLEIVCGNCHIKRHLYKKGEVWIYWASKLTPRDMLKSL